MKPTFKKPLYLVIIIILVTLISICTDSFQPDVGNVVKTSIGTTDLTLIIDAGHGGEDGGAISLSGAKESEINLEIAHKLDQIMGFFGVQTKMTRTTEPLDYSKDSTSIREKKAEDQKRRLQFINQTANGVLISIHQNNFPDGSPFGAQVLFAPTNGSKEFGEYMQKLLVGALNTKSRRVAARVPKSILLLNHIKCPALIVECGFLSNAEEEKLLLTDNYRLKVATVIAAGYLINQNNLSNIFSGGNNEG